jgi:hypothetical protein
MMDFFRRKKTEKGQRNEDLPEKHDGFPDSDKPYGLCPRCNKQSSFDAIGGLPATFEPGVVYKHGGTQDRLFYDRVVSLVCRNCLQPTIVIEEQYINDKLSRDGISTGTINWRGFFWWPFFNMKLDESLSEEIQQVLREAKINFSTQCYRSSAVMSRRALEAIASEKGEVTGNLFQKIKNLTNNGVLDKNLGEWATEIRLIGNSGAHHDPIDDVNKEDANQILLFIEELIKYLYIMPAEIQKRRAKN